MDSPISVLHNFFNDTKYVVFIITIALFLVFLTYATSLKKYSFFFKFAIIGLYIFAFITTYNALKNIFHINDLFSSPNLGKLRLFFFLYVALEVAIIAVVSYVIYSILF